MSDYRCPRCMKKDFNVHHNDLVRIIFRCDYCNYEGIYILQNPSERIINNAVKFMMNDWDENNDQNSDR